MASKEGSPLKSCTGPAHIGVRPGLCRRDIPTGCFRKVLWKRCCKVTGGLSACLIGDTGSGDVILAERPLPCLGMGGFAHTEKVGFPPFVPEPLAVTAMELLQALNRES